jgi:hypothetical protein
VRSKTISLCFVGDAVTSRPDRVEQVLMYMREFEYAANIRFVSVAGHPVEQAFDQDPNNLKCPPPTKQANGNDFYNCDIRIVLRNTAGTKVASWPGEGGTGPVPGQGCPMFLKDGKYDSNNNGWGSWSNAPNDLGPNRACLYNLKLGDDPWPPPGGSAGTPPSSVPYLNHTLHEVGHALGLAHEHERNDVDKTLGCSEKGYGGGVSSGLMTPYDRHSMMHYQFLSCGINGNYDNTGLSEWDRLALHILYPEDTRVAEFVGTTVVRAGSTMQLQSAWKARGANITSVASNFQWRLGSTTFSTMPDLMVNLVFPGNYTSQFSHNDFLGRNYSFTGVVRVLDGATYDRTIAAPVAAQSLLR